VQATDRVKLRAQVSGILKKRLVTEGQGVTEGDLHFVIDQDPYQAALDQAKGQLARDQALLDNAKADLARYQTLWSQDSVAKQTLDTQVSTVASDAATVQTDAANVETARLNLDYCTILSPISGRVGLRQVDIGNLVHSSDTNGLLVITQLEPITVVFSVPEDRIPAITAQLRAGKSLRSDAYDRAMKEKLAVGALLSLDNQIDSSTLTVKIKSSFDNKDDALFPNQFVNVRLLIDTHTGVTLVPQAAIQHGPQGDFVYLVRKNAEASGDAAQPPPAPEPAPASPDGKKGRTPTKPDGTVTIRTVTTGVFEDNIPGSKGLCEVTDGLQPGDLVVVDGVDKLSEGGGIVLHMQGRGGRAKDQGQGQGHASGMPGSAPQPASAP
ncbi:MAG TPA: efflux RND transporter periplasmic adaptor subunit, partial [Candidatus Methylacidiphilales bacterium]